MRVFVTQAFGLRDVFGPAEAGPYFFLSEMTARAQHGPNTFRTECGTNTGARRAPKYVQDTGGGRDNDSEAI
jgi:hypothetical protein